MKDACCKGCVTLCAAIQHLIHSLPIKNQTFIEFGVEDFTEAKLPIFDDAQ
jgi:hypothetical protein